MASMAKRARINGINKDNKRYTFVSIIEDRIMSDKVSIEALSQHVKKQCVLVGNKIMGENIFVEPREEHLYSGRALRFLKDEYIKTESLMHNFKNIMREAKGKTSELINKNIEKQQSKEVKQTPEKIVENEYEELFK